MLLQFYFYSFPRQLERRFFGSLVVNDQIEKRRVALQVPPEGKLE